MQKFFFVIKLMMKYLFITRARFFQYNKNIINFTSSLVQL